MCINAGSVILHSFHSCIMFAQFFRSVGVATSFVWKFYMQRRSKEVQKHSKHWEELGTYAKSL